MPTKERGCITRISIHVPREGDDSPTACPAALWIISIHVPREGDDSPELPILAEFPISIHVPREGDDGQDKPAARQDAKFQSTSPVRGTTKPMVWMPLPPIRFQSTSPVRGTTGAESIDFDGILFQSTSPVRGTTVHTICFGQVGKISIHVPREGDDVAQANPQSYNQTISIHVPREGDDTGCRDSHGGAFLFQSTSPVRGTTDRMLLEFETPRISIHVPREGDDNR